ncbi:hypothetical protein UFOVP363_10 [uncultured Caudovirales phage]|uniref:Uncharacterized protein n=1 Tax=uncultured Caudovirales phage TaxID=2100421 RepID=A0A6J7X180_9CAUD|nr:hypothetical protein UFOVP363_10 [uncultured Caudovirales phage]
MALSSSWSLLIGPVEPGSATDFTNRMFGGVVNQSVQPGSIGRGSFTFRLNNYDGALTPGGGGTYSTVDWFSQGVFLTSSIISSIYGTNSVPVFHGIVTGFDFFDDGKNSYVDLTALDSWTIAGRTKQTTTVVNMTSASPAPASAINFAVFGNYGFPATMFPSLGVVSADPVTNSTVVITELSSQTTPTGGGNENGTIYGCANDSAQLTNLTFADFLNQAILPANISVAWPTTIDKQNLGYDYCVHQLSIISRGLSIAYTSPWFQTQQFTNQGVAAAQIAFNSITRGFNIDELINTATIQYTTSSDTTTSTVTNSSSINKYGARAVSYTSMMGGYPYSSLGLPTPQQSNEIATEWVNRYSTTRFVPDGLTTSFKTAFSNVVNEQIFWIYFSRLMDIRRGMWNKAIVTAKGNNGVTQTTESTISGRQIKISPADTELNFQLVDHADNHSFYLDIDNLDEDRIL